MQLRTKSRIYFNRPREMVMEIKTLVVLSTMSFFSLLTLVRDQVKAKIVHFYAKCFPKNALSNL